MSFFTARQVFLILLLVLGLSRDFAYTEESREYQIKAAFLYNFAKFVEWPADSFKNESSPINLFVLGTDPFGLALEVLKDKTIRGRRLHIKRLTRLENLDECHILFVSASERGQIRLILNAVKKQNILTVSDLEKFTQWGGIIGLVTVDNKIQFEINLEAAQQSRLKISSDLLKLARNTRAGMP